MKLLLTGVALAGLCATAGIAQDTPPPPPPGAHGPMMHSITKAELTTMVAQHFAALDLNHDGKITREEVRAAREGQMEKRMKEHRDRTFAMLDSNHDGSISKAEFDAGHMAGRGGPEMPPPGGPEGEHRGPMGGHRPMGGPGMMMLGSGRWFDKADANHDGAVTLAEAQTAAATLFDKLDTNHDGIVSPDEMHAAFGGMHRPGGWGGHRGPGGPGGDMPPPPQS